MAIACFSSATAAVLAVCIASAQAIGADAAGVPDKIEPAAATKIALAALDESAYEAWKSKDAKFWDAFLSDKFLGWGTAGRLDKASATKEYTGADCEIKSYALSDERMSSLGKNAALVTYKVSVDGACGGQQFPADSRAATVYVREGGKWKAIFHAEAPIVDPRAVPAKPAGRRTPFGEDRSKPIERNAANRCSARGRKDRLGSVENTRWRGNG